MAITVYQISKSKTAASSVDIARDQVLLLLSVTVIPLAATVSASTTAIRTLPTVVFVPNAEVVTLEANVVFVPEVCWTREIAILGVYFV